MEGKCENGCFIDIVASSNSFRIGDHASSESTHIITQIKKNNIMKSNNHAGYLCCDGYEQQQQ